METDGTLPPLREARATMAEKEHKDLRETRGLEREEWVQAAWGEVSGLMDIKGIIKVKAARWEELSSSFRTAGGRTEVLPAKVVAGVKAGGKKKIRLTICGNFATDRRTKTKAQRKAQWSTVQIDTSSMRTSLRVGGYNSWDIGTCDVEMAFVKAEIPSDPEVGDCMYAFEAPKILVDLGVLEADDLLIVGKALYGLGPSPRWWEDHRDKNVQNLTFNNGDFDCHFVQNISDPALWTIEIKDQANWSKAVALVKKKTNELKTRLVGTLPQEILYLIGSFEDASPISAEVLASQGVLGFMNTHVDDFLLIADTETTRKGLETIERQFGQDPKGLCLGYKAGAEIIYIGVEIRRAGLGLKLSQCRYTSQLLVKHQMEAANPVHTPCIEDSDESDSASCVLEVGAPLPGGHWSAAVAGDQDSTRPGTHRVQDVPEDYFVAEVGPGVHEARAQVPPRHC